MDNRLHRKQDEAQRDDRYYLTPRIFLVWNGAIAAAAADGDHQTVDLLLVGKMAALRHLHRTERGLQPW